VAKGGVTSVKQQGQCGSCWSFSTAGAVEGAYFVATGSLISLSEEDLVQCDTTDNGCNGGLMDNAFAWVEQHGIATEAAYPYTSTTASGTRGTCDTTKEKAPAVTITGYSDVAAGDEDALRTAVAQQPVSIAIEADKSAFSSTRRASSTTLPAARTSTTASCSSDTAPTLPSGKTIGRSRIAGGHRGVKTVSFAWCVARISAASLLRPRTQPGLRWRVVAVVAAPTATMEASRRRWRR